MVLRFKPARNSGRALRRVPALTITLCITALVIAARPEWNQTLACDAPTLLSGQLWRIWTCHLVHWSADHLMWDVLTFLALGSACEIINRPRLVATLAASAALIPFGLAITNPNMLYGGLSGLDIACFTLLVTTLTQQAHQRHDRLMTIAGMGFLAGLVTKILFEIITGSTIFVVSTDIFVAAPLAHMIGAATGVLIALSGIEIMPRFLHSDRLTSTVIKETMSQ